MNGRQMGSLSALAGCAVLLTGAWAAPTVYPSGVTVHEAGVEPGYVIFAGKDGQVHLVDENGVDVATLTLPCGFSYVARPLANGNVLTESCGSLVEFEWDGTVVWQYTPPVGVEVHHDWERLTNGNTLVLCRQTINAPSISSLPVQDDFIVEVTPAGGVVWEWHLPDHFGELQFSQERLDLIDAKGGDWSHAVAVSAIPDDTTHTDPRFGPGNVLLSLKHQNTIAVIDRGTDAIVHLITDFYIGPHAAHMIGGDLPGTDNILALDSGYAAEWLPLGTLEPIPFNRDNSRVWEIHPDPGSIIWSYQDSDAGNRSGAFFTHDGGGVQRLPNGNTLITEASFGRIFEITTGLQTVWEYVSPYADSGNSVAVTRAFKVPLDWAGPGFVSDPTAGSTASSPVVPRADPCRGDVAPLKEEVRR